MSDGLFIIAGLGNPGEKYKDTRHNLGFWVIDELAARWRAPAFSKKFKSEVSLVSASSTGAKQALLMKPQTFMNLSGEAVLDAVQFYKAPADTQLLVLSDDIDLPPGALRLRLNGGAGGHNGLRSIIECLGTDGFARLRLGVGRSPTAAADVHVLARIAPGDKPLYESMAKVAADGVERCLKEGIAKAMNTVNQSRSEET